MLKKVAFDARGMPFQESGACFVVARLFSPVDGLFRDDEAGTGNSLAGYSFVLLFIQKLYRISWGWPFTARSPHVKTIHVYAGV